MRTDYKNWVFDLYGTLVDIHTEETDPRLWSALGHYLTLSGIRLDADTLRARWFALCEQAADRAAAEGAARGLIGPYEPDLGTVWTALAREAGVTLTPRQGDTLSLVFRALSLRHLSLYPGAAELLARLRGQGKRVILLSNAQSGFTRPELRVLGLADAFDAVLLSGEAGVKKPSPSFYGLLWQLGLRPEDSLMVGNDMVCDCQAAAAVGMDSVYLHTAQSPARLSTLPPRCREAGTLAELLAWCGPGTERGDGHFAAFLS